MAEQKNTDLQRYYGMFLRNRPLFFVPFLLVFSVVSLSSLFFPRIYESSTIVRLQRPQPNPLGTGRLVHEDLEEMLKTIQQMVLSRPNLLGAIRKLNLDRDVDTNVQMEELIASVRKHVAIHRMGSELFAVSFQHTDPRKAMEITNTIVNNFIDESLSMKRDEAYSSVDFIEKQKEEYRKKLEESEEALRAFKQEHIGEMPGEQNADLAQLERLRDTLADTNLELQEDIGRRRFIRRQLSSEKPMVVSMTSGEASSVEEKIRILEYQLSQLLANYTEKHPDIIRIKAEIEKLRKEADSSPADAEDTAPMSPGELTTLNPLHQRLKEEFNNINITIGSLETKKKALEKKLQEYEQKVLSIPNQEKELAALQRDYNVNEKIYDMLLMKYEEAKISKHLEFSRGRTRFQVIEPAIVPLRPVKPNPLHFLVAGLALGCAAGAGLLYIRDYLDTSTKGVREAEEVYQVPVLGAIPLVVTEAERRGRRIRRWKWVLGSVFLFLVLTGVMAYALLRGPLESWILRVMS